MKTRIVVCITICAFLIFQLTVPVAADTVSSELVTDKITTQKIKTLNTEENVSLYKMEEIQTVKTSIEEETLFINSENKIDRSTEDLQEPEIKSFEINQYTITTGKWGTVDWSFNDVTGTLTFTSSGTLGNSISSPWYNKNIEISNTNKIVFTQPVKAPSDSRSLFAGTIDGSLINLTLIEGLNYLDTSEVLNMDYMFFGMSSLRTLDVSSFDTSNVTSMEGVFRQMSQLTSLDLSSFDTRNVTNMRSMFQDCSALTSLNISNFNTTNVTTMAYMFSFLSNLNSLDLNLFDTGKVIDMSYMFQNSNFNDLSISNFNTVNVLNMQSMFNGASNLSSLNLSNFNTSNVTNMSYMFTNTINLINLNIGGFDTSQVTTMYGMFYGSKKLTSLNLTNFNTLKVRNMAYMFQNMSQLETLNIYSFDMTNVSSKVSMFNNMVNLNSLTLGAKFNDSNCITELPDSSENTVYTEYWRLEDGNTVGTSEQFMMNYDGSVPGTYVRELANDPLNPTDPTQSDLILNSVPSEFNFSSELKVDEYKLNQSLETEEMISVKNNRLNRDWSVKATIKNNQLISGNFTLPIKQFTIDDISLLGVGNTGIISKSENQKTLENNVGTIKKKVNNVSITFTDDNHVLKANNKLKGVIQYQLYNTADAK